MWKQYTTIFPVLVFNQF